MAAIRQAYQHGPGRDSSCARSARSRQFANGTRQRIVVTELPYQVNKANLIKTIADMVKDKKIEGISDIRDESDRSGMRIAIDVKKDAQGQVVLNTLYKHTSLQTSDGMILLALLDGEPKVLNLKEILTAYLGHQEEVIVRRTRYDLAKTEEREHIVKGLVIALANIDRVIQIIKQSADKQTAANALMEEFLLSDKQANAILDMRLHRLTSLEVESLNEELAELDRKIADLKDILANEFRVREIVKADLLNIKEQYPSPRKAELSYDYGEIDIADLIEKEDIVVSMTHFGYIKRIPVAEYRSQRRGGRGVTAHKPKEEDFVSNIFVCSTHDDLLFFTNKGKVFSIKGYQIPEAARAARGRAIVNLLQLTEGEKVESVIPRTEGQEGFIVMATKRGLIKKTAISEFDRIRKVGKLAINIVEGDELISVQFSDGKDEIMMASYHGKVIRFSEEDVRPMGRDTQGVRSMKLNDGDYLVDMLVVKEGYCVLTMTENGFGKRCELEEYRLQSRAGKGTKAGILNEKTGYLVNLKLVGEDEDVMAIADNGTIIRIHANEISKIGRDTQGVRVMRLTDAKVACVAITPAGDEEESEDPSGGEAAEAPAEEPAE